MSRITDCGLVGHAEAGIRINRGCLVGVRLSVSAERHDLVLGLQGIDGGIVLVRAVGVGAPQDHHVARGALDLLHPGRDVASPAWAGDQVVGSLAAGGAGAGRIEIGHPEIGHLEQVEALAHVRVTENLRLGQIDPGHGIKRVGVRRRNPTEGGRWIALDIGELPRWRMHAFGLVDIGHLDPRDLGGDQRVAIDVGIDGNLFGFRPWRQQHLGYLGRR